MYFTGIDKQKEDVLLKRQTTEKWYSGIDLYKRACEYIVRDGGTSKLSLQFKSELKDIEKCFNFFQMGSYVLDIKKQYNINN